MTPLLSQESTKALLSTPGDIETLVTLICVWRDRGLPMQDIEAQLMRELNKAS